MVLDKAQLLAAEARKNILRDTLKYLEKTETVRKEQFCNGERIALSPEERAAYKMADEANSKTSKFRFLLRQYGRRESKMRDQTTQEIEDYCLISDVKAKRFVSDSRVIPPFCIEKIPQMIQDLVRAVEDGNYSPFNHAVSISIIECMQTSQSKAGYRKMFSDKYPYSQATRNIELRVLESPEVQPILNQLPE
jgi:hypothetical protein